MTRQIREVRGEELVDTSWPLTAYAFGVSPGPSGSRDNWSERAKRETDSLTLVAFEDDRAMATALGLRMKQNVRGHVVDALGIAGVASHPDGRRGGHVRALMDEHHRLARESGQAITALYPFRPSFYAQFGYTGLLKSRSVRLHPPGMEELRKLDLDATVTLHETTDAKAWASYLAIEDRLLQRRHGVMLDESVEERRRAGTDSPAMLALVRRGDDVVGAMPFSTKGFGDELHGWRFLVEDPVARLALVRWLGGHTDQYSSYDLALAPGETPETWYTDVAYEDETISKVPTHGAPMARVLDLAALAGCEVGNGAAVVTVTGDEPGVTGTWELAGNGGALTVAATGGDVATQPDATLTIGGISALIYGTQSPAEVAARGHGTFKPSGAAQLGTIFDRRTPYVHRAF